MKPFDLEAAKNGAPLRNSEGLEVRFIAHVPDAIERHAVVVLGPQSAVLRMSLEEACHTLYIAPKIKTLWANLYPSQIPPPGAAAYFGGMAFDTEEEADKAHAAITPSGSVQRANNKATLIKVEE